MKILSSVEALAFEEQHQIALYHFQDLINLPVSPELLREALLATGLFNGVLRNPGFAAESVVSKDRYLVFEHEERPGVLVSRMGRTRLYLPDHDPAGLTHWLEAFTRLYLRKYNPDNLAAFPPPVVAEPPKKARKPAVKVTAPADARPVKASPRKKGAPRKKEAEAGVTQTVA